VKVLYYGGQKSGKSLLAEEKAKSISDKIYYIATYDNSYNDSEMQNRIDTHQSRRDNSYITIEEPLNLSSVIEEKETYLIDCMSMWIMNMMMANREKEIKEEVQKVLKIDANIIFVLNDVGSGVIPIDKFSRDYVDYSGILSQVLAKGCDEVYTVSCGIGSRIK
jgi:adenosylcobinamide kinase/adenosylcobinamide-phosphate guanylyltransferase